MKVLAICGSPRKGNTEAMLKRLLDGAKSKGASIELVLLRDNNIGLCDGCLSCDKTHSCTILDDMQQLLGKMQQADVIVFGTPSYFDNVSGLMKNFMDRTNPFYKVYPLRGKKAAGVVVGGQNTEKQRVVKEALKGFAETQKMQYTGEIVAKAEQSSEAAKNEEIMKQCFELGERVTSA